MARSTTRAAGGEHGATLVEFAIVASLLFGLLFVMIDLGMAFRSKLIVDNGVQAAARVGAAQGNDLDVDLFVLNELIGGLATLPNNGSGILSHVEVYQVNADGSPNVAERNRYFYTPQVSGCDWTPCPEGSTGYNGWTWRPDERNVVLGTLDVIGVKAYYSHTYLTGFIPVTAPACDTPVGNPTNCWTEESILRLEPLQFAISG